MTITDVINKGSVTFKKNNESYLIEYSYYSETHKSNSLKFEARNLQLAFMKLEEYLKYS